MSTRETHPVERAAVAAAAMLQGLDPARLAQLHRARTASAGAPAVWRLAARHPATMGRRRDKWMTIIRLLAILTPRGGAAARQPLHRFGRRLGEVLCDGGDPGWPRTGAARPIVSERRLAQLILARGTNRDVLLERAVRAIRRTLRPGIGVNVADIAWVLLDPDAGRTARRLARPYYRRLDRADYDRDRGAIQPGAKS